MALTPRENLLRVLKGKRPEWIPVSGQCDPYNQPSKQGMNPELVKVLANVQWNDESTIVFSQSLGLDIPRCFSRQPVYLEFSSRTM